MTSRDVTRRGRQYFRRSHLGHRELTDCRVDVLRILGRNSASYSWKWRHCFRMSTRRVFLDWDIANRRLL